MQIVRLAKFHVFKLKEYNYIHFFFPIHPLTGKVSKIIFLVHPYIVKERYPPSFMFLGLLSYSTHNILRHTQNYQDKSYSIE